MVTVPISRPSNSSLAIGPKAVPARPQDKPLDWTQLLIAGSMVAGGVMILAGKRRAGAAVAATGTALAMLDDREMVVSWWNRLPGFMVQAQEFLTRVERYAEEAAKQGHRIQNILRR